MLRFIAHGRLHRTQNALSTVFYAPRLARSSVPGLLPGTRRTRDIPTEFRATSACHRQFGGDVGPRGPSRGLAPHAASQAYRPTSRARMPCIGGRSGGARQKPTALQSSAEALRRKQDSRRQIAASMSHARGRTCPKGPENGLGMGGCADASTPSAIAAPEGRRRKGGWDAWIGYTMLDIFMRAAEAGSPTHREVPVGEGPPIRQRRDRVCQQQPEEGTRPPRVVSRHRASAAGGVNEWVRLYSNTRTH